MSEAVDRMFKVLAKHAKVERETPKEPERRVLPPLKWKRVDEWAMQSECGLYRVSKALVKDVPHYQAYKLASEWWHCIGGDCPSFEAARAVIERARMQVKNLDPIAFAWKAQHRVPLPKPLQQSAGERAGLATGACGKKGKGKHVLCR